jgi:hypothetical protein
MKSFSNILADANRFRPKQNPGLARLSTYLNDENAVQLSDEANDEVDVEINDEVLSDNNFISKIGTIKRGVYRKIFN